MEIELGSEVKCKVTGFKGIATSRTVHLNGCARIGVQPKIDKDGKHPDAFWIDEPQLEVLKRAAVKVPPRTNNGGPSMKAPMRSNPTR